MATGGPNGDALDRIGVGGVKLVKAMATVNLVAQDVPGRTKSARKTSSMKIKFYKLFLLEQY